MIIKEIVDPILLQNDGWKYILDTIDNSRVFSDRNNIALKIRFKEDSPIELRKVTYDQCLESLDVLKALSPEREIVEKFVSRIKFRFDDNAEYSMSGSDRSFPGEISLGNPHKSSSGELFILESIVHESIHCLLMELENTHGWLCKIDDCYRIVSPWTGRALVAHSFVHGAIVYHALARMYAKLIALDNHRYNVEELEYRLQSILFGYSVPIDFGLQIPCMNDRQRANAVAITEIQKSYREKVGYV